ncbi:PP2C family protein-serine/threonine phosphatase [Spirulina subsalsa]|uniref:PP2C family protein-serine/threonine phosphatase n=1 Tax=Spirulina subsalsa TaxID=54311 RepID=UPI0002F4B2BB|nr:protein phosphatase 2C domain-containing protein [Spirulina subsalsa]
MNRSLPATPTPTYLWAVGSVAARILPPNVIEGRYKVLHLQVWQDIYGERSPYIPDLLPDSWQPYLRLYPQRLHLPEIYGTCSVEGETVLLLKQIPVDAQGKLYPSLEQAWQEASVIRQVYWLWQILDLWTPLTEQGMAASLLDLENLRVQGWCVRLRELFHTPPLSRHPRAGGIATATTPSVATLQRLAEVLTPLVQRAKSAIVPPLQTLLTQLQQDKVSLSVLRQNLNQLLLEQAAHQPLRITVASATDSGPQQAHNEDSHYPTALELVRNGSPGPLSLNNHCLIVCDGIGGHEGGEVASQLAVQSLKLQVQALLTELQENPEVMSPDVVADQLSAMIRIANNLICSRNNEQKREARRRMATTLVMAVQLPQQVNLGGDVVGNGHEWYIAHVGDSRAYWLTERYCLPLTLDDDVIAREVRLGRSLSHLAAQRPDAGALTQALGTREAERLRPTIQRFILEEDGILLLCSDGLSDNGLLEQAWPEFTPQVLGGKLTIEAAVDFLIQLANQKNGHDNTSIVAAACGVSAQYPVLMNLAELTGTPSEAPPVPQVEVKPPEPTPAPISAPTVEANGQSPPAVKEKTREEEEETEPPLRPDYELPSFFEEMQANLAQNREEELEEVVTPPRGGNAGFLWIIGVVLLIGAATFGVLTLWPQLFRDTPEMLPSPPMEESGESESIEE